MHIIDYIILILVILGSLGIGILYSFKQKSSDDYLQGGRKIGLIPVSISTMVSFISAVTMQGVPAEVYSYGLLQYLMTVISVWGSFLAIWTFVPLYFNLNLVSIFEYLELRFQHRGPALTACFLTILTQICLMGIATIGPAQIMQSTTGLPTWINILLMTSVCTIYTSIGGIKAVVWADVLQAAIMFFGITTVIICGLSMLENPSEIWHQLEKHDTLNLNWSLTPFIRNSVWIAAISLATTNFQVYHYQSALMRYNAVDALWKARTLVVFGALGFALLSLLCAFAAVVVFAFYSERGCDPLASGELYTSNQIIPYFVTTMISFPGIPGLFVAAIISSTLSSVSSIQNGLSAVTWQEILSPCLPSVSESTKMIILKSTVVVYGLMSLVFAFTADAVGGTLYQISNAAFSVFGGPPFGIFVIAALCPLVGPWSAVIGCISSLCFCLWLSIGSLYHSNSWETPNIIADNCTHMNQFANFTTISSPINISIETNDSWLNIYDTSPYLYITIGTGLSMALTLVLSLIPCLRQKGFVDPQHLFPFVRRFVRSTKPEADHLKTYLELPQKDHIKSIQT